jgi:hypothetical protein
LHELYPSKIRCVPFILPQEVNPKASISFETPTVSSNASQTGPYKDLAKDLKGTGEQAHHVSQNAVYGGLIPEDEGWAIALRGNAFTEAGTPHSKAHQSLEAWWDQWRKGGALYGKTAPTNAEYLQAAERSLKAAGLPNTEVARTISKAKAQHAAYGLAPNDPVPRIPGRLNQAK